MNLKQTMKFPLETPGQKNEGKSAPGRAHLGIFFSPEPKTYREKQTHPSTLGARGGLARPDSVLAWRGAGHACQAGEQVCEQRAPTGSSGHTHAGVGAGGRGRPQPWNGAEPSSLREDEDT